MTLKLYNVILSAARCDSLEKLWTTDTVLGSLVTSHHWQPWQPGAGPGLVLETRGDQSWTGEQLTMGRPGLESGETSPPVSPRQLTRPGLPVRVHTLHDTSIPFLPPLGFTNHSPGRADKQMQRETHAAPELHPRLFHSITPDPQFRLDTRDEMRRLPGH